MPDRIRAVIDLNIILDVLQRREPFFAASQRVMIAAEVGLIDGLVAAHSITTLFYLLAKDKSPARAHVVLTDVLQTLAVAAVDQNTIEQALNLPYSDFEDAVQMMAAVHARAQYVVTRDPADYKYGPVPALQPDEFLALLGK